MRLEQELNAFGKHIRTEARKSLSRNKHNDTSELYNSLDWNVEVFKNSFSFTFSMESYGKFQDQGVRGKLSSAKAPDSPFQFGSGTGKKGGLTNAMLKWVTRKRFQFQDKKGRFMSFEQTANLITRSIYLKGLKPTKFLTRPFELAFQRLPQDIVEAYALEQMDFLKFSLQK